MGNGFGRIKDDVIYINPDTGEKLCSYNQCYKKFNLEVCVDRKTESGFVKSNKYHRCDDCNRKVLSSSDKQYNEENDRQYTNFLIQSKINKQ